MNREYHVIPSQAWGRGVEMLVFGHAGRPMLVFPSSEGRFFDWENFGMVETVRSFVDAGKLQIFCVDSLDRESWYSSAHPSERARRANDYDHAVTHDVVPFIHRRQGRVTGIMTHGCSFGAYHAVNFYLKHPEQYELGIGLSGNYSIQFALPGFCNGDVYHNDPLMYVPNMNDEAHLQALRKNLLIICCGQGAWEDWRGEAIALSDHMRAKGIPHWYDQWGHDVNHDWPWWKQQLPYFIDKLDRGGLLNPPSSLSSDQVRGFLNSL